jgi:hypothetical protein
VFVLKDRNSPAGGQAPQPKFVEREAARFSFLPSTLLPAPLRGVNSKSEKPEEKVIARCAFTNSKELNPRFSFLSKQYLGFAVGFSMALAVLAAFCSTEFFRRRPHGRF